MCLPIAREMVLVCDWSNKQQDLGEIVSLTPTSEKWATVTIPLSVATPSGISKVKF